MSETPKMIAVEAGGCAPPILTGHGEFVYRLGKKTNGRLLDGVEHNGFPGQVEGEGRK